MCQWNTLILFIAMVSCANKQRMSTFERKGCFCNEKVDQAHQVVQDDFDGQEMPRGVQQDAPMWESGEVTDRCCIDVFLQEKNKSV